MTDVRKNGMFKYLLILTICSTAGLQGWRTLFNNFAVQMAGLDGSHVGFIQSVREIPGFFTFLAIYVLLVIKEHRLAAVSILTMGVGITVTGLFPSYAGLVITTLVMSLGFHYYETMNQSLTLQYFDRTTSPWVFGKLKSVAAASNIGVGLIIFLIFPFLSYVNVYFLIGGLIMAGGLWGFLKDPSDKDIPRQRKRFILKKQYWLFYLLTFLAGARRQIFVSFAVFLLVKKFDYSVQEITILFVINNTVNYFLSPMIGRAIIRFGERKVLSLEYFSLLIIFTCYALVQSKLLVAFLYVFDHIFFNFSIAIGTYFQKISDPRDTAPSMAVGFTINHIAAVVLPAVGGLIWMIDYRITFLFGALLSLGSLVSAQFIRTPPKD